MLKHPMCGTATLVALALVVAGCGSTVTGGPATGTTPDGGGSGSGGAPGAGPTFSYATFQPVIQGGWDPATNYSNEGLMLPNLYEGLTRYDPATHKTMPLLAERFSSSDGGRRWTFELRPAKFHTGRPLTSTAVKAAILRTKGLAKGAAYEWAPVKRILTPSPRTVVFELSKPAPLDQIAASNYGAFIYDTKAAGAGDLSKWLSKGRDAGTGPYTVEQWQPGQESELRLKAVPDYWGGWHGAHYGSVLYRVVADGGTAANLLRAGEVSYVQSLNPQLIAGLKADPNLKVAVSPSVENTFLMLNTQRAPLTDVRVRQALAYGFDYPGLLEVTKGAAEKTTGLLPPGIPGHVGAGVLPDYNYDVAKAKALLGQSGYGPGKKSIRLKLTYSTGEPTQEAVAAIAKASWSALGVKVDTTPLQFPALLAKTQGKASERQDVAVYQWFPDYADPLSWFTNMYETQDPVGFNAAYYSNKTLDGLIQQASEAEGANPARAEALVRQIQEIALRDVPAIPTVDLVYQRAMAKSVQGFRENALYTNTVFVYDLRPGR